MSPKLFSLKYAWKTVKRRKVRNFYAILGISLGVSLLLGVQVSMESTKVGWQNFFLRTLGSYEAQLVPVQEPYFNESAVWDLNRAAEDLKSINALTGRLSLSVTAFEPNEGRLELGVPLVGVPINESGFGEYKAKSGGNIDLNQTNPFLIGENLAEELGVGVGENLTIIFAEGSFKLQFNKTIDYIFKDEDRGRENQANTLVMRLDALQPLVAEHTRYEKAVNLILVNFDKSVNSADEADAALNELAGLARDLFQGDDYREVFEPSVGQNNFSLSHFPQSAEIQVFQFLDEDVSSLNWTTSATATLITNQTAGTATIQNTGIINSAYIEYNFTNMLNTTLLGNLSTLGKGTQGSTVQVYTSNGTTPFELILDRAIPRTLKDPISAPLNSSYLLKSIRIFPVEPDTEYTIDYIGIGQTFIHNQTANFGSELLVDNQYVINVDERQIELSSNWQTTYTNATDIMVVYDGTQYKRDYGTGFFFYFSTKYIIMEFIDYFTDLMGQMLTIFGSLIILAGLLLIVNIQLASVQEREQQVGILRAIGTKRKQILTTTIIETILLGIIGSFIGIIVGILYGTFLVYAMGWAFGYPAHEIPIIATPFTVQLSFIVGFLISILTSILPAMKASRINIVEVIRGISPPEERKFGMKGFYVGLFLLLLGIILSLVFPQEPWKGPDAFKDVDDAEVLYFIMLLPVVGISLMGSYFFSKRWSLNIMSFSLLFWPIFNGFVIVPEWIKEGDGGMFYIIGIALSLIAGTCLFIGVNLDYLATAVQQVIGILPGMKAIALLAMQQMASKKVRSTLVFAIFSVVLTLNIFVAVWSYSWRYGTDELAELSSGGTDVIVVADQAVPISVNLANSLHDNFTNQGADLVRGYSVSSSTTPTYLDEDDDYDDAQFTPLLILDNQSFWRDDQFNQDGWTFQFELQGKKVDEWEQITDFDRTKKAVLKEDHDAWWHIANDSRIDGKPVAITPTLGEVSFTGGTGVEPGDSIWLLDKSYIKIEFIVGAIHWGNALTDWQLGLEAEGPPTASNTIFVSEKQAENLLAFSEGHSTHSLFLVEAPGHKLRDNRNVNLAREIEEWANGESGWFRQKNGIYGIAAIPVWNIFETQLDGMYRFFTFMQIFTSGGFIVGLLGLLVVSMRSVQERKREIGMMRSLGFRKLDVTSAVLFELILMGVIGLVVGMFNGGILAWVLVDVNSGGVAKYLIPWDIIGLYTAVILGSAFLAAIIPSYLASRIPPSDALRYVG